MKIVVLDGQTANPGDLSWDGIRNFGFLTVFERTPAEKVSERMADADIVITNKTPITRENIEAAAKLRLITVLATGYNAIDTEAAREKGVAVCNVPDYSAVSVSQLIFALLLEICHGTGEYSKRVKRGEWAKCPDYSFFDYPLIELYGKTIGFIGMGSIGTKAAVIAKSFGMNVICYHSSRHIDGVEHVSLEELLDRSDVISLVCPLNPETDKIINADSISKMKDGVIIINTSRGGLIDEEALSKALESGKVYAAGLDVLTEEPPKNGNPLIDAENTVITPHIAWAPLAARKRLLEATVKNISAFLEGKPQNQVN